jgi:hypothetical protein
MLDIGDMLQVPYYLSRVDHFWKIRVRMIKTDVRKFSFVNRTITEWNQLPEGATGISLLKRIHLGRGVGKKKNQGSEVGQ